MIELYFKKATVMRMKNHKNSRIKQLPYKPIEKEIEIFKYTKNITNFASAENILVRRL